MIFYFLYGVAAILLLEAIALIAATSWMREKLKKGQ